MPFFARNTARKTKTRYLLTVMLAAVVAVPIADGVAPNTTFGPIADAHAYPGLQYKMLRRALSRQRSGCAPDRVSDRDPKLAACYQAQDNDISNGLRYTHYVFCTETSRSCCQVDNQTGAASNCAPIDRRVKSRDAANPGRPPVAPR